MPISREHASLLLLFQNRPMLALELLRDALGVATEAAEPAQVESVDVTEALPAELRADFVAVAQWCRQPIPIGNGATFATTVLSAAEIPAVTDRDVATRDPELAVLSTMAHGHGDIGQALAVAQASLSAIEVLHSLDAERAVIYFDLVRAALSEAARKAIDAMMSQKYEFQSDFALRYIAEGKAEGKASAVVAFLEARGIAIAAEERVRILACTDLATLDDWVRRAVSVARVADLFG